MNHRTIPSARSGFPGHVVERVISVCEARDIDVWRVASRRIIQHIAANSYQLICPDAQIAEFEAATAAGWEITGENRFSGNCLLGMIGERVVGQNINRRHWLFQQFLKINAIAGSSLADRDLVVIWDADTVPLRDIGFVDPVAGCVLYYHGKEFHHPYFETIKSLFGLERLADVSFIAQCLPVRAGCVREMLREIEDGFAMSYVEAVLRLLPGKSGSEFSEYETIGTWLLKRYPEETVFRERNRWLRSGSSIFGSRLSSPVARWLFCLLSLRYDFVAIEKWRRPLNFKRIFNALLKRFVRDR